VKGEIIYIQIKLYIILYYIMFCYISYVINSKTFRVMVEFTPTKHCGHFHHHHYHYPKRKHPARYFIFDKYCMIVLHSSIHPSIYVGVDLTIVLACLAIHIITAISVRGMSPPSPRYDIIIIIIIIIVFRINGRKKKDKILILWNNKKENDKHWLDWTLLLRRLRWQSLITYIFFILFFYFLLTNSFTLVIYHLCCDAMNYFLDPHLLLWEGQSRFWQCRLQNLLTLQRPHFFKSIVRLFPHTSQHSSPPSIHPYTLVLTWPLYSPASPSI